MASLTICLFGQPRFAFNGASFKFTAPPKALPLLAYLLLHRAGPVSREKVAFTLWDDDSEEDARANLRRHLHHVQRAMPACPPETPWVLVDADSLQWNPAADAWIDVAEFERLSASPHERVAAVDLYTGDLLENLYDEWLFAPRDRLRNAYQSLLGDLLLESRGVRDFSRAATYAQRILVNDPWREDTVRQLMAIRYESGDRAGALAVYQQFDQRLREEMDVDPMPETSALRDAILRNEPMTPPADASKAVVPPEAASAPLLPFVGRESEMDQLRMLWSRAARGRGGVVLIGGEAGIGKSRLAAEFALVAEVQGARVLAGATTSPESAPYQALAEALRGAAPLVASLPVEPFWLGIIAQVVPELRARIPDLPAPPPADPDRERTRLFEAFSTCLEALAKPRPVVVVLEDLHWSGEATIAALQFVGRRAARLPLLIIATYRDEETPRTHPLRRARRELQEDRILSRVSPRPLQREAVAELMERTPALSGRASELASPMVEQSAGNPLFLGEVIRNYLEGAVVLPAQPLTTARLVIEMRVSRLSETSRALAEAAAVVGKGFNVELVRDVTGWSESDVVDGLSDLLDRHIVKEAGGRSGYAYAFAHHVIQSTIYAGVPADDRRRRHRRIARVLEDAMGEQRGRSAADVARHYDLGEEPEHAATAWLEAGRYAGTLYAWDEALRYLDRCLELTQEKALRLDALLLRESIRARRGDRAGQQSDLDALGRLVDDGDAKLVFSIVRRKASLARAVGERDREGAFVEELLSRADQVEDDRLRAEALVASAAYTTLIGDNARARAAAKSAQALYARLGDVAGEMEARCRLVETAYHGGAFELVEPLLAQAREAAKMTGNPALLARAINTATHVAISEQRYPECRELALEARALYRSIGDREAEADAINRQASAAARLSLLAEARRCYDEALAIYEAIGKRLGVASVLANGGIQSVRVGQIDAAHGALTSGLAHFEALKDVRGQTACNVNLSYVHLLRQEADQAKARASAALAMARSLNHAGYEAAALANLGAAERDLGDAKAALAHMRDGIAIRRKHNEPSEYADELGAVALLHVRMGDLAAARAVADELAVALQAASPMLFMPQTAYWSAAQAFHALGDKRTAQQMLKKASDVVAEQAAAIGNAAERSAFMSLRVNQEIEAAYERKKWPAP